MSKSLETSPATELLQPAKFRILKIHPDSVEIAIDDIDPRTIEKPGYLNIGRILSRTAVENGWVNPYVPSKNQ